MSNKSLSRVEIGDLAYTLEDLPMHRSSLSDYYKRHLRVVNEQTNNVCHKRISLDGNFMREQIFNGRSLDDLYDQGFQIIEQDLMNLNEENEEIIIKSDGVIRRKLNV